MIDNNEHSKLSNGCVKGNKMCKIIYISVQKTSSFYSKLRNESIRLSWETFFIKLFIYKEYLPPKSEAPLRIARIKGKQSFEMHFIFECLVDAIDSVLVSLTEPLPHPPQIFLSCFKSLNRRLKSLNKNRKKYCEKSLLQSRPKLNSTQSISNKGESRAFYALTRRKIGRVVKKSYTPIFYARQAASLAHNRS